MKTKLILGAIVFLFVGLAAVCGYIVGHEDVDILLSERAVLIGEIDRQEAKTANLDSCLVMCHEQGMFTYNKWRECDRKRVEDLDIMLKASLPDSTVMIDGVLYERSVSSNIAHNDGVLIPFQSAAE